MYIGKRLAMARRRRRLTARALAERAGLAYETISRFENDKLEPDELTIARLARALEYPIGFFSPNEPDEISTEAVSFRSFSKMSARERDAAIAAGALGLELNAWIEERFSLPNENLPDLSYEQDPEVAATLLRQYWSLGERPIGNVLGLLESNGVRIFSLSENTASVNAFSFWRDSKPFVFLNNFKSAESSIFDTMHEVGHLVMHKHGDPKGIRSSEREADAFASAFLMPRNDVRSRVERGASIATILKAKMRWRVSAMAMTRRLLDVGLLSAWQYQSSCIELSRRGYRSSEPIGIERETSPTWRMILEDLWKERITKADIAASLNMPLDELEGLIWNLAAVSERPSKPNALRLVE